CGVTSFRIAAVSFELDEFGEIIVNRDHYRRLCRDDSLSFLSLRAEAGANIEQLADEIRHRVGDSYGISVITPQRCRAWLDGLLPLSRSGSGVRLGRGRPSGRGRGLPARAERGAPPGHESAGIRVNEGGDR